MAQGSEQRRVGDRRGRPRGGRRPDDVEGLSPLVMLIGSGHAVMGLAEAVLAKLKFAVAPNGSVDDALRVIPTLRPDIIVAGADDAARIRREAPELQSVVEMTHAMRDEPTLLVESIRDAIRSRS